MKSTPRYFSNLGSRVYIDSYPSDVFNISEIHPSMTFWELCGGVGNDLWYLLDKGIVFPKNLYFVEKDPEHFCKAYGRLSKFFSDPNDHMILGDVNRVKGSPNSSDIVYMNNSLHAFSNIEQFEGLMATVVLLLKPGGSFVGRALSSDVDKKILEQIRGKAGRSFHVETADKLISGKFRGASEGALGAIWKKYGGSNVTVITERDPNKPTANLYFRCIK
ncbi:class I SAM-dependent methyltransferase [Microbulbifer epialgicus]|uniref:Class I SAM-dependent methyltransferase n=1 Tax=Microbulbifer epialgicus TaxID=393907 RepID=A0ABV4P267_9GAMM